MKEIDKKEPRNNGGSETLFFLFILVFCCQMKRTSKLGERRWGKRHYWLKELRERKK